MVSPESISGRRSHQNVYQFCVYEIKTERYPVWVMSQILRKATSDDGAVRLQRLGIGLISIADANLSRALEENSKYGCRVNLEPFDALRAALEYGSAGGSQQRLLPPDNYRAASDAPSSAHAWQRSRTTVHLTHSCSIGGAIWAGQSNIQTRSGARLDRPSARPPEHQPPATKSSLLR